MDTESCRRAGWRARREQRLTFRSARDSAPLLAAQLDRPRAAALGLAGAAEKGPCHGSDCVFSHVCMRSLLSHVYKKKKSYTRSLPLTSCQEGRLGLDLSHVFPILTFHFPSFHVSSSACVRESVSSHVVRVKPYGFA